MSNNGFFIKRDRPIVLGHRGVPILHQENTISGFRRALEMGLDGVEFDVYLTEDDKCVIFHDEDTERLTGVKGNITDMTWDEISRLRISRKIDMGGGKIVEYDKEERIPLLEDVLDEFGGKLLMDVEMKAYAPKWSRRHTGTEVARLIRENRCEDSVVITSFDFFMLYYLEREYSGLNSGFAYDDNMVEDIGEWFRWVPEIGSEFSKAPGNQNDITFLNFILESDLIGRIIGSSAVAAEHTLIDSDTVSKFHDKNMVIGAYTLYPMDIHAVSDPSIDQEAVLKKLVDAGVNWIETDDPERLMQVLSN